MSIIEDGEIAEVLYLIPKQSMMEQLPFINPNDYILCEKLAGIPAEVSSKEYSSSSCGCNGCYRLEGACINQYIYDFVL